MKIVCGVWQNKNRTKKNTPKEESRKSCDDEIQREQSGVKKTANSNVYPTRGHVRWVAMWRAFVSKMRD